MNFNKCLSQFCKAQMFQFCKAQMNEWTAKMAKRNKLFRISLTRQTTAHYLELKLGLMQSSFFLPQNVCTLRGTPGTPNFAQEASWLSSTSPLRWRTIWMSRSCSVTCLAWSVTRLASSRSPTRYASAAVWRAVRASAVTQYPAVWRSAASAPRMLRTSLQFKFQCELALHMLLIAVEKVSRMVKSVESVENHRVAFEAALNMLNMLVLGVEKVSRMVDSVEKLTSWMASWASRGLCAAGRPWSVATHMRRVTAGLLGSCTTACWVSGGPVASPSAWLLTKYRAVQI